MKIRLSYILFILTIFATTEVFSQVDRSIGYNPYRNMHKKEPKKTDIVEDGIKYFTKQLNLDTFQQAAIREILKDHKQETLDLMAVAKDMPIRERNERSTAISRKIYEEASPLLSKEQVEKYRKMLKIEDEENEKEE